MAVDPSAPVIGLTSPNEGTGEPVGLDHVDVTLPVSSVNVAGKDDGALSENG